jgi:hypothetical protein
VKNIAAKKAGRKELPTKVRVDQKGLPAGHEEALLGPPSYCGTLERPIDGPVRRALSDTDYLSKDSSTSRCRREVAGWLALGTPRLRWSTASKRAGPAATSETNLFSTTEPSLESLGIATREILGIATREIKVPQISLCTKMLSICLLGSLLFGSTIALAEFNVNDALEAYDSANPNDRKTWELIFGNTQNGINWANRSCCIESSSPSIAHPTILRPPVLK